MLEAPDGFRVFLDTSFWPNAVREQNGWLY